MDAVEKSEFDDLLMLKKQSKGPEFIQTLVENVIINYDCISPNFLAMLLSQDCLRATLIDTYNGIKDTIFDKYQEDINGNKVTPNQSTIYNTIYLLE